MYALVQNGAVARYPYSFAQLRKDQAQISFPRNPDDQVLASYGVLPVTQTERPNYDPIHERLTEHAAFVEGDLVQVWNILRRDDIPTVEQVAADQTNAIKSAAGEAILARLPYHRQLNYQQRAIELLDIRRHRELTEQETADYARILTERNWLEAMRAQSNRLEAEIATIAASDISNDQKRTAISALKFEAVA